MGARSRSSSNLSVGINNIFSVDPLRVTLDENEAPREPRFEECEVLVRKLFETHKQQKQQVRLNVSVGRGRGHLCPNRCFSSQDKQYESCFERHASYGKPVQSGHDDDT